MAPRWSLLQVLVLVLVLVLVRSTMAQQTVSECASVADLVILVSTNNGPDGFKDLKVFLRDLVTGLDLGHDKVRVGLAQYSSEPYQEFLLKDHLDKRALLEELEKVPYRTGGTETGKALDFIRTVYFTAEAGSRMAQRVPQIAVVITDGDSTDQVLVPAQELRAMGVLVFTIGVGQANDAQLQEIASRPFQRFMLKIDSYQALSRLTEGLLQTVCISMEDIRLALAEKFADIFFLVDSGLSATEFSQVRGVLTRSVNQLNVGADAYRIGLAQYGAAVKTEFLLNAHQTKEQTQADVRKFRLRRPKPNEPRNLGSALEHAEENFFTEAAGGRAEQGFRQYLVVLSGKASDDSVYRGTQRIKSTGVTVVGLSLGAPMGEIKFVSTAPYAYKFVPTIAPTLKNVFEQQEAASAVTGDCQTAKLADIVFIVDESGSIGTPNFQLVRTFLHSVVSGLEVGPNRVRVGIVTYNDGPTAQVYLDSFNNKTDLLSFIKILPYHGGGTNTGKALNFTRETVFTAARGSRLGKGVQQVAVIITDGESQDDVAAAGAELRRAGVTVYALGVKDANKDELHKMASYPANKHVFIVDSFTKLKSVEQVLQKTMCHNIFREVVTTATRRTGIKEGCGQTDEADIFFLIDHSGSIYPNDFQDMKKFIIEFLDTFRISPDHVRVGVAKFADSPNLEFDLTQYSDADSLKEAVKDINQEGGGTETGKALDFMQPLFKTAEASRGHKVSEYLIVITDGKSSDQVKVPAATLRAQGVTVYAIGVKNADTEELLEISGDAKKMFFVYNFDALKPIKDDIITDICSTDVCKDVSGDLLFLVDSSGSIYPEDYQKMKDFMKNVMGKSSVGPDSVHFGVVQFSTVQRLEFPLNRFFSKEQMIAAVEAMTQIGGGTDTGKAITFAQQYFDAANGGRPQLKQRLVVITDGEAQDEVKGPSERLRDLGVIVYAIGVVDANTTQLLEISGTPERVYAERDFNALKDLESQLTLEICEPQRDCKKTEKADIIFLVDGSTSITLKKFRSMQKFMSSMVNQTTVGSNLTRFGVILYSNDPNSIFSLNRYTNKREVLRAIDNLIRPNGDTYTGKALDYALQFFGPQHGGRAAQRIPQLLMVITDGDATDRDRLEPSSKALAQSGVRVFGIGVEKADRTELEIMAGHKHNRVFYVDNFDALETLYKNISDVICTDIKPECEKQQADLVFLLDQSGSIHPNDYRIMKNFTTNLVRSFSISQDQVRVGLAQFSSSFEHQFYLNDLHSEEKVAERILGLRQLGGGTNIGHALQSLREYFTPARGSRRDQLISQNLVLVTDGESQDEVGEAAQWLRKMGVEVFVIGVGDVSVLELRQITSDDRLFTVDDFGSLDNIRQKVEGTICRSKPPSEQTECARATVADIVFLVDGSSSIGLSSFEEMRGFLRDVFTELDIGEDKVRVGLAQYSSEPYQEFLLKDHLDKRALLEELEKVPYRTGGTETGKALDFIRTVYFTAEAGSRMAQRVPQIAVVITDGDSTDQVLVPAQELRAMGVLVFTIGVGQANDAQLQEIASRPFQRFMLKIDSYQALSRLTEGLLQTVCISMEDIRLALAEKFADIFFLVDGGLSVFNFQQVIDMVSQVNVGADIYRIGLAKYGSTVKTEFLLNAHQTKEQTLDAMKNIQLPSLQPNELRNLGSALEHARMNFFTSAAGGRAALGFRQYLVVLSGKASDDLVYRAARRIKSTGVTVMGVSLGAPMDEMKAIATAPYVYNFMPDITMAAADTLERVDDVRVPMLTEVVVQQETDSAVTEDCQRAKLADIVFIVDESGSITTPNFELVRNFLHSVVSGLEVGPNRVRVGIVTYNERPTAHLYLDNSNTKMDVLKSIKYLPYQKGKTRTGKALNFTRENVFTAARGSRHSKGVQQVAVVITDGKSQDDVDLAATELRRAGVTVYALGVKNDHKEELEKMASHPANKHVFIVDSFASLQSVEQDLRKTLCHNIFREAITTATRTTDIKKGCVQTDEADIFFLIDNSGSIYPNDFQDMKKFITEVLNTFRIGPNHVRVGVAKYADNPILVFDLDQYSDPASLKNAVQDIRLEGGGTETGKALDFMGPRFRNAEATRGKVRQHLIVITDGESQDTVKVPAETLRTQGVDIYAIGVKTANITQLLEISDDKDKMFFVHSFADLKLIKDDVITDICAEEVCKDVAGDILFLLDSSQSIDPEEYKKMKDFIKNVMRKSPVGPDGVHFGVIQFSTDQHLEFSLNQFSSRDQMDAAVDAMKQINKGINTGAAIDFTRQYFTNSMGGRPEVKQRLVVITGGKAQDQVNGPAKRLRDSGVVVYAIGVVDANSAELQDISGTPDKVYEERNFDALKYLENQLALEICEPKRDCKKTEKADIIFLVDGSTSISERNFQSMQTFMSSIVNRTTVGSDLTHFGVILYSNDPNSIFSLNRYTNKREVLGAIANLKQPIGDTYTGKALDYCLKFFGPQHGGRAAQRIPQLLMVITDGEATDRNDLEAPSKALEKNGVTVFSIGVEKADRTELEIMAGHKDNRVFYVDNFESLETLYKNITPVICTDIKPMCLKQQADLVFLLDSSESIKKHEYVILKNFTSNLVRSFNISQDTVRVGLAQFSTDFKHQFYLNDLQSEEKVVDHIQGMKQQRQGTLVGNALRHLKNHFMPEHGSRRNQRISQNLVLITDGDSDDEMAEPAEELRGMGVDIFVIGVGSEVEPVRLEQITSNDRFFTVETFQGLENIKKEVVKTICEEQQEEKDCSIDIAVGFDVSHGGGFVPGSSLLSGQTKLRSFLPEIISYLSSVPKLCCTSGDVKTSLAFRVLSASGQLLFDTNFEPYNEGTVTKLLDLTAPQPTRFNSALMESFREMLRSKSKAGVKVLLMFSDGLDEDFTNMKLQSEMLLKSGVNALLVVALEGAQNPTQLHLLEFGRGFRFNLPLNIGMHSIGSTILDQIDTVSHRECCNVTCKCSGHPGERGPWGRPGVKGDRGQKGFPGFIGDEGITGERGRPGVSGPPGIEGCPGIRGQKGTRGHSGDRGKDGEDGLDGVNGEQGLAGSEGPKGPAGHPGAAGSPGLRGEAGLKGQRGLRGDPGEPGQDNTIPGPKGDTGNPGLPGAPGEDGGPGGSGSVGNPGMDGRRGPPGEKGALGAKGETGPTGETGSSGPQGPRAGRGSRGPLGPPGLPGPQGKPGETGQSGLRGRRGANGQKGQPGEQGVQGAPGPLGPRGPPGLDGRDGYGRPGPSGIKGNQGFPGHLGLMGEDGFQGPKGFPGRKGSRGRGGNAGTTGSKGSPGDPGYAGHKGFRGPPGERLNECQMVRFIRDNCACSYDSVQCPAVPTELVVALDMSDDVTPAAFERQRSSVLSLLSSLSITESNCPRGARVSVVAYSARTKYLIRFSDYRRKSQLLDAVRNIALERTSNKRHLGAAMRFVGQNVLKRVRSGALVRKVALFLSNGATQDPSDLVTAVMELRALDIVLTVASLRTAPEVEKALEVDDSGSSIFTVLTRGEENLVKIQSCAVCYDPCSPAQVCSFVQDSLRPLAVDLDLALVLDGSREVPQDEFQGAQELLGAVVSQVQLTPTPQRPGPAGGARVALLQMSGATPTLEFGLNQYQNQDQVQTHLLQRVQQQRGSSAPGQTLDYALRQVLLKSAPRRRKALLFVLGSGSGSVRDQGRLDFVSQQALCEGVAVAVVTVGSRFNGSQVQRMASPPLDQHLIHLDQIRADQQDYARRFIRVLLSALSQRVNSYPPASVQRSCGQFQGQTGQGPLFEEEEQVFEEEQERFQEQTGPGQSLSGGAQGGQVDLVQTWTRGDGQTFVSTDSHDVCSLAQDPGSCADYSMMWFFDAVQRECSRFWFGGCGGNANRFSTQQECEARCLDAR